MADHSDSNSNAAYKQNYAALAVWYNQTRLRARREDIFAGMLGAEFLVLEGTSAAAVCAIEVLQLDYCRRFDSRSSPPR